jgi:phage replication-related protein YjqB (UPF0714/DUF867 family)
MKLLEGVYDPYLNRSDAKKQIKAHELAVGLHGNTDYDKQAAIFKQLYKLGYNRILTAADGVVEFDAAGEVL